MSQLASGLVFVSNDSVLYSSLQSQYCFRVVNQTLMLVNCSFSLLLLQIYRNQRISLFCAPQIYTHLIAGYFMRLNRSNLRNHFLSHSMTVLLITTRYLVLAWTLHRTSDPLCICRENAPPWKQVVSSLLQTVNHCIAWIIRIFGIYEHSRVHSFFDDRHVSHCLFVRFWSKNLRVLLDLIF